MTKNLPQHVAIVMDGNGRWAKSNGHLRFQGHKEGIKAAKLAIKLCLEKKISILSLFAFSTENWSRPAEEVNFLMQLFVNALQEELEEIHKNDVVIRFIGERSKFSPTLQERMQISETKTAANKLLTLNIAINYSGKWDILQAIKSYTEDVLRNKANVNSLDEATFAKYLVNSDLKDPDLLIRTGNESRLSNFFFMAISLYRIIL